MGKINGCLRCLFIFFNVLYLILGCLLIFGLVTYGSVGNQMSTVSSLNVGWVWVFTIGVLLVSSLGIYAGCSEKELVLKIFAGLMLSGMIIMMIFGIIIVVQKNKVRNSLRDVTSEYSKVLMEDEGFRQMLSAMQSTTMCCGLNSAQDWGTEIPASCSCKEGGYGSQDSFMGFGVSKCKARPQGTSGPEKVFQQNCSDILLISFNFLFQIAMGFFFGFAVTALLGLLVTIFMIYQIRRHDGAGGSSIAMKGY